MNYNEHKEYCKKMTDGELADFFLREYEQKDIISAVFNFFNVDCLERCRLDVKELDRLIKRFDTAGMHRYGILSEIIKILRSLGEPETTKEHILLDSIKEYIDEHLCENFKIEEMANELNVSYYYMCHMFKRNVGETISNYRNRKRVLKAEKMLVETESKVIDIATECGYDNASYFASVFTKHTGMTPAIFREAQKDTVYLPQFYENDIRLVNMLKSIKFLGDVTDIPKEVCRELYTVQMPDDEYAFLHEAAIIEYKGVLFASWYNCPETELKGRTPIRGRRSYDGGKTWTEPEIIVDDSTEDIMFCPPVYGVCDGKLYLFLNQMVAADHIHSLDLFVLDEEKDKFVKLWSRPIPFKLNTNVYTLPNGKLILAGRCGEIDRFPNTPAVLISEDEKIDGEWRLVKVAENGILPDGESHVHPETNFFYAENKLFLICRNDLRLVPIVYVSEDFGETWSEPYSYDIPMINSKMYSGELTDGRHYIIGNIDVKNRSRLAIYFTDDDSAVFTKRVILHDGAEDAFPTASAYHYPVACEHNGKLYIIYTVNMTEKWVIPRCAAISVIDLEKI